MNRVILIGNLTDDPKVQTTSGGITRCAFKVATARPYKDQQTGRREADFHNVVAWRQLGDLCAKYLSKGRKVCVEGAIQYRQYEDGNGVKQYITNIVAENVEFLSAKPSEAKGAQDHTIGEHASAEHPGFTEIPDEELPF